MAIQKKYMKLGLAALAVSALIIGLSVGTSQSNKNKPAASSSQANGVNDCDYEYTCSSSSWSKSSKTSKSSKSSSWSSWDSSWKSGDEPGVTTAAATGGGRRKLSVPGTEDYERVNLGLGAKMKACRGELVVVDV